eukprot:TRINITY_DN6966_c0_g1_i1.p1 TRINITY_DN6966_c0_g1~~TRINITY_DN6966_c0_g1_i1.p1  ORF type:complete len:167 (+),score=19.27 TRINITY_DN6966_c0_g1_i1:359-859(+)
MLITFFLGCSPIEDLQYLITCVFRFIMETIQSVIQEVRDVLHLSPQQPQRGVEKEKRVDVSVTTVEVEKPKIQLADLGDQMRNQIQRLEQTIAQKSELAQNVQARTSELQNIVHQLETIRSSENNLKEGLRQMLQDISQRSLELDEFSLRAIHQASCAIQVLIDFG